MSHYWYTARCLFNLMDFGYIKEGKLLRLIGNAIAKWWYF